MLKRLTLCLFLLALTTPVFSDGLLMPTAENYPKDFLKNRLTHVTVNIHGIIAETYVYQEFVNEWHDSTDAVYSFPLPPNARATEFIYWYNDIMYKAVLRVKEQAVNPGTGEGGIVAEVNEYIGRNGIKIALKGIAPGNIQKVQLHYISLCNYYQGKCEYKYPLKTGKFVTIPIDHLQFSFHVQSNSQIVKFDIPSHPDYRVIQEDLNEIRIEMIKPKAFLNHDLDFFYEADQSELGLDFYSVANDTTPGHFALFVRPPNQAEPDSVLPNRMFFLLGNSSRMFGYKLSQSVSAISKALDLLTVRDRFNIILFNNSVISWKSSPQPATPDNIQLAQNYLSTIRSSYGSRMDLGLKNCLEQIPDDSLSNSILIFTDGRSPIDPREIESLNVYQTGIFPIGIGEDLDRARLEMTAALNYGYVTYIAEDDNLSEQMLRVFNQIYQPILKNVVMEYGSADLSFILPEKIPTTFAGSYFFTTGRYQNAGMSALAIAGSSISGVTAYNFNLDFSDQKNQNIFAEFIWAKEHIDVIEQEIEIYGESEELKNRLIELSLLYNIRCRYTAYLADYQTKYTNIEEEIDTGIQYPKSYLIGNYPNPFNPVTTIKFYINPDSPPNCLKFLKIYNSLGQLVYVIDISHLASGFFSIQFMGKDYWGQPLPSGVYFVVLQVGKEISKLRITLVK